MAGINPNTGAWDETGSYSNEGVWQGQDPGAQSGTKIGDRYFSDYKPFDFASNLGGYREAGKGTLKSADNPELTSYFQNKYGAATDTAYRNQLANVMANNGFSLWDANTGQISGLDPRAWDQYLLPAFQASGAAADPRFKEYSDIWHNVQSSGQAVDAANAAAVNADFKKNVLAGLALTGGVMGAGALGFLGGGGGAGALAGEGAAGLSPQALQAIGTGGAIDVGGSGLTMADWLAAQASPFAGMGGSVGAGQLGAGGLGLGSFTGGAGGGFGVGGNTAIEAGMNVPGGAAALAGGGTPQAPGGPGYSGTPGGGGGQWPGTTGPGGGLSPNATQAITAPPGNAPLAAGASSAALPAGQGGGGDFVSGILDQFKKNALSLGLMGLSLAGVGSQQNKQPEAVGKLEQNANVSSDLARQYLAAAQAGQLTGPQQASLDQYKQQAKNQIRQYFSSIGQFDSTSRIQAEAQIDQTAVAMQQQLVQQTLQNGLSLMGAANTPLGQVAQYQMGQDQALVNAMGSFAQGIGSLFGQQAGQGQINRAPQAPTQNPMYPPNAGPQQPAVAPSTTNQPILQDNNWNV